MIEKNNSNRNSIVKCIYKKLTQIMSKSIFFLLLIGFIGFVIRAYYFPYEIPFIQDSLDYFSYAIVTSQVGSFPDGWNLANNGWPGILSVFFFFYRGDDFFDYIYLQRYLSIIISILTIMPLYQLCRKFFDQSYALVGITLFAFNPHVIQNSLLGINNPFFILLFTTSLVLFVNKNIKIVYLSFAIAAISALVRYEGLLLILPFSIMFIVKFWHIPKIIPKYLLALCIFVLVLVPMAYIRIENTGQDGLSSHLIDGPRHISNEVLKEKDGDDNISHASGLPNLFNFLLNGAINLMKNVGLLVIPNFIFFIFASIFLIIKNRKYKKIEYKTLSIILVSLFMLIPAWYAYSKDFQEVKYLFILFPLLSVLSIYNIRIFEDKFSNQKIISVLVISGIIVSSLIFFDHDKTDYKYEKEMYSIAKEVIKRVHGINSHSPVGEYIKPAEISQMWPLIPSPDENGHITSKILKISLGEFTTLEEYIKNSKDKGLTHLVVSGKGNELLSDVFYHEQNYPYLIKEFDSSDYSYANHVKIYKVDYELFALLVD